MFVYKSIIGKLLYIAALIFVFQLISALSAGAACTIQITSAYTCNSCVVRSQNPGSQPRRHNYRRTRRIGQFLAVLRIQSAAGFFGTCDSHDRSSERYRSSGCRTNLHLFFHSTTTNHAYPILRYFDMDRAADGDARLSTGLCQ